MQSAMQHAKDFEDCKIRMGLNILKHKDPASDMQDFGETSKGAIRIEYVRHVYHHHVSLSCAFEPSVYESTGLILRLSSSSL